MGDAFAIGAGDVVAAASRIAGHAVRTPVIESAAFNERVGGRVLLKCENFQRTGSFKFRGGFNALAGLSDDQRTAGVISYSSGNHAQGVALAARLHGVDAVIVMPTDAPPNKMAATKAHGATIVTYDRYTESREHLAAEIERRDGRTLVVPYDNALVMAGQGTVALELLDDHPEVDQLFVCLGGGGLLSGCSVLARDRNPEIGLYGVEPETGDDHRRSRGAGERITIEVPETIADGQQTTAPGRLTWPITNALVTEFLGVSDVEIVAAMRALFEDFKLVAEPSGASSFAAILAGQVPLEGRVSAATVSGGNVNLARYAKLTGMQDYARDPVQ